MAKKIEFSNEQLNAINAVGHNILVSAGAGSGKTAVLTERVFKLVKDGNDISRFLILTFTNAASAEMKARIRKRLAQEKELLGQSQLVGSSHIETFDSFALYIVKKYSIDLKLPSNISVIDDSILQIKTNKIIEEIFDEYYEKDDKIFIQLVQRYCIKKNEILKKCIIDLLKLGDFSILNKEEFLNGFVNKFYNNDFIQNKIKQEYESSMILLKDLELKINTLECVEDANQLLSAIDPLLKSQNYDELYSAICNYSTPRKKGNGSDGALRNYIAEKLKKFTLKNANYGNSKEIISFHELNKPFVEKIVEIAKLVNKRLFEFKKSCVAFSFADIAHLALDLIKNPRIKEELRNSFDFIMVDEYQDTSDIQEEVITTIGNNNIYMVGDVKQSIYGFRNANCDIFIDKYDKYSNGQDGEKISLNTSYRSRKEIVDVVNEIFSILMNKENNPFDYANGHYFGFGAKNYNSLIEANVNYNLGVINYDYEKGKEREPKEIELIAKDIINKINTHYKVVGVDKKTELAILRDCTFSDFAILIDTKKSFNNFKAVFTKYNIPLLINDDEKLKETEIMYAFKNLLTLFNCFKNNIFDKSFEHAYVSVSRSFLLRRTDQEIFLEKINNVYQSSELSKKFIKLVQEYGNKSNYEIFCLLLDEFDFYKEVKRLKQFNNNIHRARVFMDLIKSMDLLGYTLDDVISYFENLNTYDLEIPVSNSDSVDDAVTIMSIHKSKGLEFPIVYLPQLYSSFNSKSKTQFSSSNDCGLILPKYGESSYDSFLDHFLSERIKKETFPEKLRLLYVAMTRAKERLILLNGNKTEEKSKCFLKECNSFSSLLKFIGICDKYRINPVINEVKLNVKTQNIDPYDIIDKKVNIPYEILISKKASKTSDEDVDKDLLDFGNQMHYLLQITDFVNKDTSFIEEPIYKKYVENVLSNEIFSNLEDTKILHEYNFFDEINDIHGIIDLLIVKPNEIDIVDFKLKNINDEAYNTQLNRYKDYIKQITSLPIKMFLISCISGEVREIEE